MQKNEIVSHIARSRIMAVVRIDSLERGIEICEGCLAGGVDVMEISYTSENANDYIKYLAKEYRGRMLIGAGTVLDPETARNAVLAGARFIIAPTFSREVALLCNRYQIPYAPGCTSYSEMVEAMEYGASFIKCFPISNFYGPDLVKVVKTPLPFMPLLISGGVTLDNVEKWLDNGADCLAIGGLLTKGSKEQIAENAARLMAAVNR